MAYWTPCFFTAIRHYEGLKKEHEKTKKEVGVFEFITSVLSSVKTPVWGNQKHLVSMMNVEQFNQFPAEARIVDIHNVDICYYESSPR